MMVSHKYQFVYLAPRRTGSSTIADVLEGRFKAKNFSMTRNFVRHDMNLPMAWKNYFVFVTVRNPYTRFASLHNFYYKGQPIDVMLGLNDFRYRSLSIYHCIWGEAVLEGCVKPRVHQVVRLENLQEDFNSLPFVKTPIQLPHWNAAKDSKLYGRTLQRYVREYYVEDFEHFGYDPDDTSLCEVRYL